MKEFIVRVIDPEEIQWYEEEPEIPELVRCKDCKHFREAHYEEEGEQPYIKRKCGLFKYQVVPDGFCYQGERKDGELE